MDKTDKRISANDAKEALRILDLVVAEWRWNPTLVANYDLHAIVWPAEALLKKYGLII